MASPTRCTHIGTPATGSGGSCFVVMMLVLVAVFVSRARPCHIYFPRVCIQYKSRSRHFPIHDDDMMPMMIKPPSIASPDLIA